MSNINITINLNVDERVTGLLASLISKLGVTTVVADKRPEQTPAPIEQPKQPALAVPAQTAPAQAPADMPDFVTTLPGGDISDQALTEHTRSCVKRLSDAGISPLGIKTTVYKQFGVNQALEVGPEQRATFIAAMTDYVNTKLQEASHA